MKSKIYLVLYSIFLLVIFLMAYLGHIPTELFFVPFFDSMGHFALYGLWGYFFASAFDNPVVSMDKTEIQLGILIVIPITVVEESLQSLSPVRTFSLIDMGWGVMGILLACLFLNYQKRRCKRTH